MFTRRVDSNDAQDIARFYYKCPYSFFRGSLANLELLCSSEPFWIVKQQGNISGFIFSSNYDQKYAWISGLGISTRNDENGDGKSLISSFERYFHNLTETIVVRETPRTREWTGGIFLDRGYQPLCSIHAYEKKLSPNDPVSRRKDSKQIREAENDEIRVVQGIDAKCFPGVFRYSSPAFARMFENAAIRLIATELTNSYPVGFLLAYTYQNKIGNIARIAVLPDYRNKGLGLKLMRGCIRRMIRTGVRSVILNTQKENFAARRLYEALEFIQTETETVLAKRLTGKPINIEECA
ncbi:MAG: GNAT family N-acetyltransferase [Candidatus Hodarchaeota archaeon]